MGKLIIRREYDNHEFYHDLELSYKVHDDEDLCNLMDLTSRSLVAMGFSEQSIEDLLWRE